jgi:type IV pilus assembly protein PilC
MQLYKYTAKDQSGATVKGKVEARDLAAAAQVLRDKEFVIISLKPNLESESFDVLGFINNRIKSEEVVAFTQQLSTMIDSGLPLSDGLSILQNQSKPAMAKVAGEMARDIQGGSSFADALAARDGVFSSVYISTVRAGEASGKLDEMLNRLAETEEKKREFASKTKGALVYPVIVIIMMIVVMIAMMVFVVPKLTAMFDDFGTDLPVATKLLIGLSGFLQRYILIFIGLFVGAVYGLKRWYTTKIGRERIDTFLLRIPVYGNLTTQVALADITRTLALLVGAGISILEALEIVTQSAGNVVFEKALKTSAEGVEKGLPLATMLAREQFFPPLLSQMVSVGEETGQLSEVLQKVARFFESESEHAIKNLTTAIEPLIMVVLGVGVMFLMLAIVMPIYNLTSSF